MDEIEQAGRAREREREREEKVGSINDPRHVLGRPKTLRPPTKRPTHLIAILKMEENGLSLSVCRDAIYRRIEKWCAFFYFVYFSKKKNIIN